MNKLFVSFTATLRALRDGKVSDADLATGLFHFRCGREHALDPWKHKHNEVLWFFRDVELGRVMHTKLADAIERAEREGRVLWVEDARDELERSDKERPGARDEEYRPLSDFLVRNGHGAIAFKLDGRSCNDSRHYCYPGVADRVKEAGLDLEVIH